MQSPARFLAAIALALLLAAVGQPAQSQQPQEAEAQLTGWTQSLNKVDQALAAETLPANAISDLRTQLSEILAKSTTVEQQVTQRLEPLRTQIQAMGPPPEEGKPPEPTEVAKERDKLNAQIGELEGLLRRIEASRARAQNLLKLLSVRSSATVAAEMLERGPLPITVGVWRQGVLEAQEISSALFGKALLVLGSARPGAVGWSPYLIAVTGLVITLAFGALIRHRLKRLYGQNPEVERPSYPRAVAAAAVVGFTDSLIPAASAYVLLLLLRQTGIIPEDAGNLARGVVVAIVFYSIVGQLARAAFAPSHPQWAIVPLSKEAARRAGIHLNLLLAWIAVALGVWIATEPYRPVSPELYAVLALAANGVTAVLLVPFLGSWLWNPRAEPVEGQQAPPKALGRLPLLRLLFVLAVAAIPFSAVMGYANLSYRIAGGVVFTAILIGGFLLVRTMLNAFVAAFFAPATTGGWMSRQLEITEEGSQSIGFWFGLLIDLLLLLIAVPLLLLLWGVPQPVISYLASQFMEGFTVGGVTFEPLALFWAVLVFAATLIVFRFLRRLLSQRVLSRTRLDVGARHSISATLGYVGFFIALLLAIGTMGLDLSNIAIIAGALSVGIGFGLQNVVNNFVSGLLLLIERPIKVGDWIVVGGFEGTVKRISVRSTEIETFDRAEVIVPNSELVSAPVVNWTHKTRIVRLKIPVGVAYGSDTRLVEKILLDCAKAHPDILSYPAPFVVFQAFGDSSLNFELRVYARDTNFYISIASDLHYAIDDAFRKQGVEIPFPQRDLHWKDFDRMVEVLRNGRIEEVRLPAEGGPAAEDAPKDKND